MSKPDGILKIVSDGKACIVRYFKTSGIPKSANIEILEDDIGIENPLGVGISHQSNVPVKVLSAVEDNMNGSIDTIHTDGDIFEKLSDTKWNIVLDNEISDRKSN